MRRRDPDRGQALDRLRAPFDAGEPLPIYEEIAEQIVRQRAARALSQRELAELCGTTQSAIARIERGRRAPRVDTLARIAGALDCELEINLRARTVRLPGSEPRASEE